MPSRLDRLILGEIIGPFLGSAFLFVGLFFAGGELVRYAEYLQSGQSWVIVAQLMALTLPGVLALTFPIAALLSSLLGFGRLSNDSEIIALVAAGTRFERIILPVALFGLVVSLIGAWFGNSVVPASSRGRNIIIDRVKNEGGGLSASQLTAELRSEGKLNTLIHVEGDAELASGRLSNVSIELWEKGRLVSVIFASKAYWKKGTKDWRLENYYGADFRNENSPLAFSAKGGASQEIKDVSLDTPSILEQFKGRPEDTDTSDLLKRAEIFRKGGSVDKARELEVEAARRNAIPFASLCFALLGAPLGVSPRRQGKGVGFGVAVVVTFLYWTALQIASVTAKGGLLPAPIALAIPNIICLGVAFYFIRRVLR
jgi:lipopolysaccharide export system permease protein